MSTIISMELAGQFFAADPRAESLLLEFRWQRWGALISPPNQCLLRGQSEQYT